VAVALFAVPAGASAPRIETRVTPSCGDAALGLEHRVERALEGARRATLEAAVAIDASSTGYRVTIVTRDASSDLGTTEIAAPTCDEAVDAAVVVLALALTERDAPAPAASPDSESHGVAPEPPVSPNDPAAPLLVAAAPARARVDHGVRAPEARPGTSNETRVALATGVDAGTLPHPTLTLSGGIGASLSTLELRALARYGLPATDETVETGLVESTRHDFATVELRACAGSGQAFRLSACAGAEAGAVRIERHRSAENAAPRDERSLAPRLSGTLAALLAHRGGLVEPEIELAGVAVALGRSDGAPPVALRVSAGAAVAF
jgi:hypothetical protein